MSIKAYKGFNKDMTCRGFQYEDGKEYETEMAKCCESGFHAYEYPLDCFEYYSPNESVYREVELDGNTDSCGDNTKIASTKIKIGASLNIAGIVKAAIEYTSKRSKKENGCDNDRGASSATGYYSVSSATGYCSASSATGYYSVSSATGDRSASSATGDYSASSATGYRSASSATGYYSASSATGYCSASSATGYCSASSATGYYSVSSAECENSIAVAWGYHGKAKGVIGSYLVLADWEGDENNYWTPELWSLKGAKMVRVDGEKIKENTFYTMVNGEIKEVEDE